MNLIQIENCFRNTVNIKSERHFVRYLKMINYFQNNIVVKDKTQKGLVENHHILPVAIFPEYSKEKWNLVNLPVKAHYLVHFLLYKSVTHVSCVYSFNQMRRVSKVMGKLNCRLYASARKDIAELMSIMNIGREASDETKANISKRLTGTTLYRSIETGEIKRMNCGKQPEGWIHERIGKKQSKKCKEKMSKTMKGRIWQFNEITKEVKYDHKLHDNFTEGYPEWFRDDDFLQKMIDLIWLSNSSTGATIRINKNDDIPDGYEKGRNFNHNGFSHINSSGGFRMIDLKEKKFVMVDSKNIDKSRYINSGHEIDKTYLFKYNGIYYGYLDLLRKNPELPDFACRNIKINEKIVPKPHNNMTIERREFCKVNQGKSMLEIGLKAICILDFEFGKDILYV